MKVISVRQVKSVNFYLPNGIKASRPLYCAGIYQQTKRVKGDGYYYKLMLNYGFPCFSAFKAIKLAKKSGYIYESGVRDKIDVPNEKLWFIKENI